MRVVSTFTSETSGWRYLRVEGLGHETFRYLSETYTRCGRDKRKNHTIYRRMMPGREDRPPICTDVAPIMKSFDRWQGDFKDKFKPE